GRYIIAVNDGSEMESAAASAGVAIAKIGTLNDGGELKFGDEASISITWMRSCVEDTIPNLMNG
ncbi:hypothetical protein N8835_07210, partial [Alphaproteobacteria bacterium]|nr:hypothetical protein [Alphaproteobacteria bacterium]